MYNQVILTLLELPALSDLEYTLHSIGEQSWSIRSQAGPRREKKVTLFFSFRFFWSRLRAPNSSREKGIYLGLLLHMVHRGHAALINLWNVGEEMLVNSGQPEAILSINYRNILILIHLFEAQL